MLLQNMQVLKEVMLDMGAEIDASKEQIDRLHLDEQGMQEKIDQMQQKFNFIRAKTETKLFQALPDLSSHSPTQSLQI